MQPDQSNIPQRIARTSPQQRSFLSFLPPDATPVQPCDRAVEVITSCIHAMRHGSKHPEESIRIPNIPLHDFESVQRKMAEHPDPEVSDYFDSKLRLEYNGEIEELIIKLETWEHSQISQILNDIKTSFVSSYCPPARAFNPLVSGGSCTLPLLHGSRYQPDGLLAPLGRDQNFPTVVLEVAHSQSQDFLLQKGMQWLEESNFRIRTAILIKINYPLPLRDIKMWVYNLRHDGDDWEIVKTGPKTIYRHTEDLTATELDDTFDLGLEDVLAEFFTAISPPNHPHHQVKLLISVRDLKKSCTTLLRPSWPVEMVEHAKKLMPDVLGKRIRGGRQRAQQEDMADESPEASSSEGDGEYQPKRVKTDVEPRKLPERQAKRRTMDK
ncbi:hypothetical protein BD410DRAFT_900346 [Rickenella mellea]|uniref:Restriction endonuclease domain-containing protein n=1 Tax=Rickenella mellea TaxID=50990 RepID=A0A4Y7PWP2_9AGAM|nr:hypothetical protein BD410DRAFT_900346 [Rickenella mellea]